MKNALSKILLALFLCMAVPASAEALQNAGVYDMTEKVATVVVVKSERRLYLLDDKDNILRAYPVGLGFNPVGDKVKEGDGKTPEGKYFIDFRNDNSEYFLSMRISYPDESDRARAKKDRVNPGGQIFIHGEPPERSWMFWHYSNKKDWTQGCIALNNRDMKEIWNMVPKGTPIFIEP